MIEKTHDIELQTTCAIHKGSNPWKEGWFQPYLNQEHKNRQWNKLPLKPRKLIHSTLNHLQLMYLPYQVNFYHFYIIVHQFTSCHIMNFTIREKKSNQKKSRRKTKFLRKIGTFSSCVQHFFQATIGGLPQVQIRCRIAFWKAW